jgi:hypothetical protein
LNRLSGAPPEEREPESEGEWLDDSELDDPLEEDDEEEEDEEDDDDGGGAGAGEESGTGTMNRSCAALRLKTNVNPRMSSAHGSLRATWAWGRGEVKLMRKLAD